MSTRYERVFLPATGFLKVHFGDEQRFVSQRLFIICPQELPTRTHVFIRRDAVRQPLQPIYDGPFRVLRQEEKVFIVDHTGKEDAVSVDRLKPAFLDIETSPNNKPRMQPNPASPDNKKAVTTTRSDRRVHWFDRYSA
ncbi:unnamed protein product [Mesocestoides corti]|uniref:Reverse transcriptase n=1 Tax=Mesocestoides corti TaxID=53468 RepID=A0A0R3URC3_MESCO|nr:unnamed protein product [Mesocestoides corti]